MKSILSAVAIFFSLSLAAAAIAQNLANPTQEEMIAVLSNVWVLYVLMLLGTLASQLKQANVAKQSGSSITYSDQVFRLREWVVLFITNTLSFAALIYADQLNFVSAVTVGFALNELVDLDPTSSRSSNVIDSMTLKE